MKNINQKSIKIFLSGLFLLLLSNQSFGSHAMGGDMTYTCLGNNQYQITFSFYRDCFGISAPPTMDVQISNTCGLPLPPVALNLQPIGPPTEISPACSTVLTTCQGGNYTGIQEWIYTGIVTLTGPCANWTFSHSESARNAAITTITGAGSDILFVYSTINNLNGLCNNSPTFTNNPVPFACTGQRFCFNHGAFDIDGDSIAYQLITPRTGPSPGDTVDYLGTYSAGQPVASNPPITFDPITGDICMTPTTAEVSVFAVLVNEYRNGVLIGQVERDVQITVSNCNNFLPLITGMNGLPFTTRTVCANDTVSFFIASFDQDATNTTTITWNNSIPGASFTTTGGQRDTAYFFWIPTTADISNSAYCFTATVDDDNCPYLGSNTNSYCITVVGLVADAGPDQTVACNVTTNLTATATGGGPGGYTYTWFPGGSTGATLSNVGVGTYYVEARSSIGCTDMDTVVVSPGNGVPNAAFTFNNNCSGAPIQFTDQSAVVGGTLGNWLWDFGDGATSNNQSPSHAYTANGTYDVQLIVITLTGCIDTLVQQISININVPTALFTAPNVCDGSAVNFTDMSVGNGINAWSWDFNDPASGTNTSTSQNPSHTFSGPGNYNVTLNVTNASGCTGQIQQSVTVNAMPVINVADATICLNDNATLTAPAGFTSYSWSNGDTSPSITVSPAATSSYTVNVTDVNTCTTSDAATVTVNALPVAFAGNDQTICQNSPANLSATGGSSYVWNPGSIAGQNIIVYPSSTQAYDVLVTDVNGCTGTDQVLVNVNPFPTVDAGGDLGVCRGSSATLNVVNGSGTYLWTPGGYTTSSITVTPLATTTYTLVVSDAIGCSGSDIVTIQVNPIPQAAFVNSGPVCISNPITFTDNSTVQTGSIASWNWDFGNGSVSNIQNPAETYSGSGTFNVQLLVISNAGCRDSIAQTVTVNALPAVDAGTNASICPGFNATLTGTGSGTYSWSPGGETTSSITISPSATTDYQLTVTDANGCQNTDLATVVVNPVPTADAGQDQSVCFGSNVDLLASGGDTYVWSPGNIQSAGYSFTASSTGTYSVLVTNQFGCEDTDDITVQVNPIPVANFMSSGSVCEDNDVVFTDNSAITSGSINTWQWNFGNSTSSNTQSPTASFSDPGTFQVSLIVTSDQGCQDTITQQQTIWATPVALFSNSEVCMGLPSSFSNLSSISDGSALVYAWDLGDGYTTSDPTPQHQYNSYGAYNANLVVTSPNGCSNSFATTVLVHALPTAAFTVGPVCEDDPAAFIDGSTIPVGNIASWNWTFGDNTAGSNSSNPSHTYTDPGTYPITMAIVSDHGCPDNTTGLIRIIPKPVVDFATEDVCFGFPSSLTDLSYPVTGSIVQYQWNFGDGSTSSDQNPEHTFNTWGWFQVSLTAVTDSGCVETLTVPNAVNIWAPPTAQFTNNATEASDIYPLVSFTNLTSTAGLYFWNFGDGDTSTMFNPTHMYAQTGVYDVQLITIDLNGCVDTILIPIEIRPTSTVYIPNAFTPNGDTKNDVFQVYSSNIKQLEVQIYDRWGIKIIEWKDVRGGWDGKVNGTPAQADTYVYRVSTIDVNEKKDIFIGHVSLVR
jgi:gliding motility-associated-like protein